MVEMLLISLGDQGSRRNVMVEIRENRGAGRMQWRSRHLEETGGDD